MRVLVVNAGSSSLKWSAVEQPPGATLASGSAALAAGQPIDLSALAAQAPGAAAVAHRVVHGGLRFRATTRIDADVRRALEELRAINPIHAARALAGIDAAQAALPGLPHFACFDTAFHASLPEAAATYAIPRAWTEGWGLRRFGFHGLSVAHAVRRAPEVAGVPLARLVVCHLGSGCSMTAVDGGRSMDTTMGFSPLEGLVMSTRSGSVDPGLLLHVLRERGLSPAEVDRALEHDSGLLGISGVSADLREVLAAADAGDARAKLAYEVFMQSVRRGLGQMIAALQGLTAIVFTGGIGEHSARVRRDALANFGWLGIALDAERNEAAQGDADVSASDYGARIVVITAREDLTMAREVAAAMAR
jgi:acetate kinase